MNMMVILSILVLPSCSGLNTLDKPAVTKLQTTAYGLAKSQHESSLFSLLQKQKMGDAVLTAKKKTTKKGVGENQEEITTKESERNLLVSRAPTSMQNLLQVGDAPVCKEETIDGKKALRIYCNGVFVKKWSYEVNADGQYLDANGNIATWMHLGACKWSCGTNTDATRHRCYTGMCQEKEMRAIWAGNDPKVMNLAGERFDILALGTFPMISIAKRASVDSFQQQESVLDITATIDRADPLRLCTATYIQNVTIRGKWIEGDDLREIGIRAVPRVAKYNSLEIGLNKAWHNPSNIEGSFLHDIVPGLKKASWNKILMNISDIELTFEIDAHKIRDGSNNYANFLNMNIKGMSVYDKNLNYQVNGLLAYDDHGYSMKAPDGCGKQRHFMDASHLTNSHEESNFLSSVQAV